MSSITKRVSFLNLRSTIALILVLVATQSSYAFVWENKNQWSQDWELKYQEWVQNNWNVDYFKQEGPYKNMVVDCADAVYSVRYIFSAENGLPFVVNDPTGRGSISNSVSRYDNISDPDKRKRAFLKELFNVLSTHSLPKDTYYIAISRQAVRPGTIIRTHEKNHHSWTMTDLNEFGMPHLVFSSRPARTTLLQRFSYPFFSYVYAGQFSPASEAGWRAFRQPQYIGRPEAEIPGYSLEQFQLRGDNDDWPVDLQNRLKTKSETIDTAAERLLRDACESVKDRVGYVNLALEALKKKNGQCFTRGEIDDYSTPSKDRRMRDTFSELSQLFEKSQHGTLLQPDIRVRIISAMAGESGQNDPAAYCRVNLDDKHTLALGQVILRAMTGQLSSDPYDPMEVRWGYSGFPSAPHGQCP